MQQEFTVVNLGYTVPVIVFPREAKEVADVYTQAVFFQLNALRSLYLNRNLALFIRHLFKFQKFAVFSWAHAISLNPKLFIICTDGVLSITFLFTARVYSMHRVESYLSM